MYRVDDTIVCLPEKGVIALETQDPAHRQTFQNLPGVQITKKAILIPMVDKYCRVALNVGFSNIIYASPFWLFQHPLIEGKYKPMVHQLVTAAFIVLNPRSFVLSDCRLGKTGSAIVAVDYLQKSQAIAGGALVITTVTTMRSVWYAGIMATLPDASVHIVHGKDKQKALEVPADWFITNYDTVRLHRDAFIKAVIDKRISCVLVDELTHTGNATSQRHKAIASIINQPTLEYAVGMTGTPGNKPEYIYGMTKTINPSAMPYTRLGAWLDRVAPVTGYFRWQRTLVPDAQQIFWKVMQPSIRFRKEAILDLPPVVFQTRSSNLMSDQKELLRTLRKDMIAVAKSGETITAANAAVLVNKLLQIPLGFIKNEERVIDLPHDDRTQTILDIVMESDRKVVIFCMFKRRLRTLESELRRAKISVSRIDGDVVGDERAKILSAFTNKEKPQVLVCHPTTVGYGTELSVADTLVLEGPPMLGDFSYTQTIERLSSPKQQAEKISIIKVAATKEERALFAKLESGQTAGKAVAALFEELKYERLDNIS